MNIPQNFDTANMNSQFSPIYQQGFKDAPPSYTMITQGAPNLVSMQQQQQPQISAYSNPNLVSQYPSGSGTPSSKAYRWPRKSVGLVCPRCGATVTTRVESAITIITLIAAVICCCITCILGWLPFCVPACKKVTHYCPYCSSILGIRKELR